MAQGGTGTPRRVLDETDSTNAEAMRMAAGGARGPLWITAARQAAGRGRRGRPWSSPEGNLYATLLLNPPGGPELAALRSFTASLALFDTLVEVTGRAQLFALKWPNDVLLSGRKLAGILLESSEAREGRGAALAVGIGVNLATHPESAALEPGAVPPVSLAGATGLAVGPRDFLDLLDPNMARWEARLVAEGFAPVRAAWLARAARLGETVTARLPGREISGVFRTVDEGGAIRLETASGPVALPAAEIFFAERGTGT